MQRLFLSLLICLGFVLPATAHAWWQDDWHYRKQISVDTTPQGAAINEALGRTALLVRLHTGNFTFDGVKEDGSDLRFVAADDKTVLNHQIESFDPLMGMALIWVDVPKVEGGQRQDIWMYYGNQKAPATANGQLTFDPSYTAIYHFEGGNGIPAKDTTAYGNTAQGATGASIDGVIGRALQFSGQPLLLPASPSLQHNAGGAFTFSAWVRLDQASGEQLLLARREGAGSLLVGVNQGMPFVEVDGQRAVSTQPLNPGQWQHLALSGEGSRLALYVNGRETASLAQAIPSFNSPLAIGADLPVAAGAEASHFLPFTGAMDELRLSKVARPAALLLADASAQGADTSSVSAATIEAIRCSMDGVRTRENQQLSAKLSTLSNAIAGGPYIGLLGTVLGIMVVFLGTAMAGDVNINAIAPGMAAALLATAMGLFVAIPALFGYNRLITRNKEVGADMRVFVDEFITRLAELHGESQQHENAHWRVSHSNASVPA